MRPWHVEKEITPLLDQLSRQGVNGIVGTRTAIEVAKTLGMHGEILDTGPAAMKHILDTIVVHTRTLGDNSNLINPRICYPLNSS